jgi:hypothetical protein
MTIEASPPSLNESLDYDDDGLDARRAVADALEALAGHLRAHREHEERSIAATARRLPDVQPSKVADGDLPTEEDQQ